MKKCTGEFEIKTTLKDAVSAVDRRSVTKIVKRVVEEHAKVALGRRQQTEVRHGEVGAEKVPEPADDTRVVLPAWLLLRPSKTCQKIFKKWQNIGDEIAKRKPNETTKNRQNDAKM